MIKELIARGIGFSPGSTAWIPTLGLDIGDAVVNYPSEICITGAYLNNIAVTGQYVYTISVSAIYPQC